MLHLRWSDRSSRVNPLAPGVVAVSGLAIGIVANRWVGAGIAVGAVLAYINDLLLSRRVDIASAAGDVGRALLVMQLGLLVTCTIIAAVTIVLIKLSLPMAIAAIGGFTVAHLATLATFYWTRARSDVVDGRQPS